MKIQIGKFGTYLISRPEGRDAALVIRNQFLANSQDQKIELDFDGVIILTPSWIDEVIQEILKSHQKSNILLSNTSNSSVQASIDTVFFEE